MEKNVGVEGVQDNRRHFVLVHGVCMGAWCWYKLKTLLENKGHRVTAVDLLASGVNETRIDDIWSFSHFNKPLFHCMERLHQDEKVILVGNFTGGISIAMAAERYPKKVKALVFLGAFIPDTKNPPSYVIQQFLDFWAPENFWKDSKTHETASKEVLRLGPDFLSSTMYNLSPKDDALLAGMLVRPSSLFREDLSSENPFTDDNYGSVHRVVITINSGPKAITKEFNAWQITNARIISSQTIGEADDMAMVSKPDEVADILLNI